MCIKTCILTCEPTVILEWNTELMFFLFNYFIHYFYFTIFFNCLLDSQFSLWLKLSNITLKIAVLTSCLPKGPENSSWEKLYYVQTAKLCSYSLYLRMFLYSKYIIVTALAMSLLHGLQLPPSHNKNKSTSHMLQNKVWRFPLMTQTSALLFWLMESWERKHKGCVILSHWGFWLCLIANSFNWDIIQKPGKLTCSHSSCPHLRQLKCL